MTENDELNMSDEVAHHLYAAEWFMLELRDSQILGIDILYLVFY